MKKLFPIIFVLIFLITFSSCKQDTEKLLIGSWNNTNVEISKINEISKLLYHYQVQNIEQQINDYSIQLENLEESQKTAYKEIISNLETQLSELTIERVTDEIISNYNYNTFSFYEDSTFVIKSDSDSIVGTWALNKKDQTLKISIETDEIYLTINDISNNNLVTVQNTDIDTINFDISLTFTKE